MNAAIDARAAREAARWMVRLQGGELDDAARQALARWRAAHPHHETAWQRAEHVCRSFGMLPAPLATTLSMPVLDRPAGTQRRAMLKSLALLIVAGPAGWTMLKVAPWQAWTADARTATGEIRHLALADGSELSLNTASAADIVFSDALRLVRLPYHLSAITQATAVAALRNSVSLLANVEQIKVQRDRIVNELTGLGLTPAPSDSNFVFFGGLENPHAVWESLLSKGVLIRDVGIPGHLRVTAGTEAETSAFLTGLRAILTA